MFGPLVEVQHMKTSLNKDKVIQVEPKGSQPEVCDPEESQIAGLLLVAGVIGIVLLVWAGIKKIDHFNHVHHPELFKEEQNHAQRNR